MPVTGPCAHYQGAQCPQSPGRNTQVGASSGPGLSSKFTVLIVWFLYFRLSHVYTPPVLVWPAQGDIVLCIPSQGTWWFTGAAVLSKPKVTLPSPWCRDKVCFLHCTFFPRLAVVLPSSSVGGTGQGHCLGWIYWRRKSRQWQLLSPEWCPWEKVRLCSGGKWDPHSRAGLKAYLQDGDLGDSAGGGGWGGQFSAQKEAAT